MKYSRRSFVEMLGSVAATTAVGGLPGRGSLRRRPPNIVYIMSDELGYYELSCMGHPHFITPNIDRLAAEGIRFTQALAGSSLCAPTRCCLMTGKHSGHTSIRKNDGGTPLREGEETLASVLKQAGYVTGGFGKWGCGGRGSTGVPEQHGFDVFFGYYDQVHAHSYYPKYLIRNSEEVPLPGNRGGSDGETYSHYVIVEEALKFIRRNRHSPFFCYLPVTPPHGMFDIPDSDPAWEQYRDMPWPEEAKRYAAMVNMVDRNVGEVLSLLKRLELDRQTIIFFSGDNGGNDYFRDDQHPRGFHGPNVNPQTGVQFRGHKGNLYEGGLRIPMIVRWPGHIAPGRVSEFLWYFPDLLPTLAELAGLLPPKDVDGLSIVPELLGQSTTGRRQPEHEYLYWELNGQIAVRMGDWKAVQPGPDKPWELYNLRRDPSEQEEVAARYAVVLAKLKAFAQEAHQEAVEGVFHDRTLHERDQQAKWGDTQPPAPAPPVNALPRKGLISTQGWQVVRVSSESTFNGRVATAAFDGDPLTWWHTRFEGGAVGPPHELVIDLGRLYTIRGFCYLARQDESWNGTVKDCEFYVASESPQQFETKAVSTTLRKTKEAQVVSCEPLRGRYVLFRALSEVNGGPWASMAEFGVIGEP